MNALPFIPILVILAWIWLLLFQISRHWLGKFPKPKMLPKNLPEASVIIPARNEEQRLPELLKALASSRSCIREIIVVNDSSTDATSLVAVSAAQTDPRIQALQCPPTPDDWSGKTWALWQGANAATAEWFLFCDADMLPAQDAVQACLATAVSRGLDALSIIPRMPAMNFGAALLTACMAALRAIFFTPAKVRSRGVVQGAFFLVHRRAYEAVGGHETVRFSLLEDMDFGRKLIDAGFALESHPGRPLIATRMYDNFGEAWEGFSKHLFAMAEFSFLRAIAGVLLMIFLVLLPFASFVTGALLPLAESDVESPLHSYFFWSLPATAAMYAGILSVTLAEGLPVAAGLFAPLTFFVCAGLLGKSIWGYSLGGIHWKGRAYKAGFFGRESSRKKANINNDNTNSGSLI